jgi:hypothetical protein
VSVETVLRKISDHNADVLGCIATHGGKIHHNLPDLYELIDTEAVTEYASNMFTVTDALETEHEPFNHLFLEYAGHSIYARRLDDGVLVLANRAIERAHFKKMQIGVNLFIKPLQRALNEEVSVEADKHDTNADAIAAAPSPEIAADDEARVAEKPRRRWF